MGASKMAKAADYYANVLGWQIFACLKKSKIPATEHGYLDAAIDPALPGRASPISTSGWLRSIRVDWPRL